VTRLRALAVLMAGGLAACSTKAAPVATATFAPRQRAQIVHILRDAMRKDPTILRDAIVVLQADNDRIERQAQRSAIANRANVLFDAGDPFVGNAHAGVTIVEFFDTRCPYCRQLAPMLERFVSKDGNVRLVYKDFPILGPASELGSRALLAAQRQGRYEDLRSLLMAKSSSDLTENSLRETAQDLGLDWPRLQRDMNSADVGRKIAANKNLAQALGIDGTPTIVIGEKIVEGADIATIAAAVANARHDRSKLSVGMSTSRN
jgi:protein-disulfide isomerase